MLSGMSGAITRRRLFVYAALLLALEVVGLAWFVAGTHGWIAPLDRPLSTDFVSFYAAGRLAVAGTPALAYDPAAHFAAEQAATVPGIAYNFFLYPPTYLLICAALARLPYLLAFVVFQIATLLPALLVARRILDEHGRAVLLPLLAFPPVFFALGTGQNAFLTAALFGGAMLLLDWRPILSGVLLGALCYKPHLGLLVPVALIAAGRWRTFLAAAATMLAYIAASALAFGWQPWISYLGAMAEANAIYASRVTPAGLASPFGAALVLGASPGLALSVQIPATLAMLVTVFIVWRRIGNLPVRAAVLLAATPLAVPVFMFYDLMLSGMALAWLLRWGRERGAPPWLGPGVALLFIATMMTGNFDPQSHLLIAPLVAAGTLALALRAAVATRQAPALSDTDRSYPQSRYPAAPAT
jgi:alpha-1,2-mannosyltransferase